MNCLWPVATQLASHMKPSSLLLLLALTNLSAAFQGNVDEQNAFHLLNRVLDAISKAMSFYEDVQKNINLDGLIGTRIVDGQLHVLLKHLDRDGHDPIPDDVIERIRHIQRWAEDFTDRTITFVANSQPKYYSKIGSLLEPKMWRHDYPAKDFGKGRLMKPLYEDEAINEDQSDECLTEFMGSNGKPGRCHVTNKCWFRMTAPGYRKYSLSHEVFYLEIGEMLGCFHGKILSVAGDLEEGFCANMHQEATEIAQANFPEDRKDLFMEQAGLCGILGYRQFFNDVWLKKILSWQRRRGCYGLPEHEQGYNRLARVLHGKARQPLRRRGKREERVLNDGCQVHRTAVALAALAEYVRFIIEFIQRVQS